MKQLQLQPETWREQRAQKLISQLMRPTFVANMARACGDKKGSDTRYKKALAEIDKIASEIYEPS